MKLGVKPPLKASILWERSISNRYCIGNVPPGVNRRGPNPTHLPGPADNERGKQIGTERCGSATRRSGQTLR